MPDIAEYTKNCPRCGSLQSYGTKYDLQKAVKKNVLCRSCAMDRRDALYYEGLKICSRCKETKLLTEFPKAAKGVGGLKAHCVACNRILNKSRWQRRDKEGAKTTERRRATKIKEYIVSKKDVPCADCKKTFPSVCVWILTTCRSLKNLLILLSWCGANLQLKKLKRKFQNVKLFAPIVIE